MEWSRRILLQMELERAQETDSRLANIIKGEPDEKEREALLVLVAEALGGLEAEEVERLIKRDTLSIFFRK